MSKFVICVSVYRNVWLRGWALPVITEESAFTVLPLSPSNAILLITHEKKKDEITYGTWCEDKYLKHHSMQQYSRFAYLYCLIWRRSADIYSKSLRQIKKKGKLQYILMQLFITNDVTSITVWLKCYNSEMM